MSLKKITVYTDGACSGNPGPGGWGAVLIYKDQRRELSGFEMETTSNRMEITAAIRALSALKMPCEVDLYTDSAYLENAFNQNWINGWIKNNWIKKSDKSPVLNQDLWLQLLELTKIHSVSWHKVKGHANNAENNRCDQLATTAIKESLTRKKD
ncbi:MAG: ribonuclease HI [Clostridia bacterium]|nr:ribonuclease HI [Clostridia bacterium]